MNALFVVVATGVFDHIDQFFLAGKSLAVVPFPFQDTPEAFHRPIVDALGHAGHALRHTGLFQLVMKRAAGILKAPVAMEQRMSVRVGFNGSVKGLENQRVVIPVSYDVRDNTTIIEIEDGTEIYLVYLNTLVPFELCHIGKPFLI